MKSVFSPKEIDKRFESKKFIIISDEQLAEILNSSKIIFEQDTKLRGYIRIFKFGNRFYFQETTNRDEIAIRRFKNEEDAMKLLKDRMQIYDKMWDGCGCKINYYE